MKSFSITTLLALLLLSCSEPEIGTPLGENAPSAGREFRKDTLISRTAVFVSDTATETFHADEGGLYIVEVGGEGARIVKMYDPAGNLMVSENSNWGYHNTEGFKAPVSGTYQIKISYESSLGNKAYSFKLLTMEYPEELNGTWVLIQGEEKAFGHSQIFNYTSDYALNYWSHKDGIITYVPWWYLDGRSRVQAFPNSWLSKFKYRIEDDLFILTIENEHCLSKGVFQKYSGDINAITFINNTPVDDSAFQGSWYLAHEKRVKMTDSTEIETAEMSYTEPGASSTILKIESDAIFEVTYNGSSIDTTSIYNSDNGYFQYRHIENNSLIYYYVQAVFDEAMMGVEGDGWYASVDSLVYERYESDEYPKEWVTTPTP